MYFLHGWLLKGKKQKLLGRLGPSPSSLASLAVYAIGQSSHRVPQDTSRLNLLMEVGKGHIFTRVCGLGDIIRTFGKYILPHSARVGKLLL